MGGSNFTLLSLSSKSGALPHPPPVPAPDQTLRVERVGMFEGKVGRLKGSRGEGRKARMSP